MTVQAIQDALKIIAEFEAIQVVPGSVQSSSLAKGETHDSGDTETYGFQVENLTPWRVENITAKVKLAKQELTYDPRKKAGQRGDGAYIVPNDRYFGSLEPKGSPGAKSAWREFEVQTSDNAPGGDYHVIVEFEYHIMIPQGSTHESVDIKFLTLDAGGAAFIPPKD